MNKPMFKKAERKRAKLRLGLSGPSGSGKTMAALRIASGLGGRVAVIDTEHGSASLYADAADFDTLELEAPYTPERYIEAIQAAEDAGYDVIVIDSITHEWAGSGGCLELVDKLAQVSPAKNSYFAWGKVTPRHNAFINAILQSKSHIIVTMRSKQDFVLVDKGGKQVPQKVGLAPIMRDGFEYELTASLDLEQQSHLASASKDRTRLFVEPAQVTEQTGRRLADWLNSGAEPPPPEPQAQPQPEDPPGDAEGPENDETYTNACRAIDNAPDAAALNKRWSSIAAYYAGDASTLNILRVRADGRRALWAQAPQGAPA